MNAFKPVPFKNVCFDEQEIYFGIFAEKEVETLPFDRDPILQLAYATFFDVPGIEILKSGRDGYNDK
jgi:hypothetical protein